MTTKKTWYITGASSGIGEALVQYAIEQGDDVIAVFRKEEQVKHFENTFGANHTALLYDVTNHKRLHSETARALKKHQQVDVLVNNAGYGFAGAIEETSDEEMRHLFEVHYFACFHLIQELLPAMRARKSGQIIQLSSHGGVKAFPGFGAYNASKFALEGMSEALAAELQPLNISVTLVEPGPFRTGFAGDGFTLAKDVISDYDATAGAFRTKIKSVDGKQEGDPNKAAKAIFDVSRNEAPPLRLILGNIALNTIQSKIDSLQADLDASRTTASEAVF